GEDDDADDEIAAHHEVPEGFDDVTGGVGAVVAVGEDQAGGGEVECQPHHGGDQQYRREGREFERRLDEQRRHQDQHREDDRDRQQAVEQHRRQRQDKNEDDAHDADREADVGGGEGPAHRAEAREAEAGRLGGGRRE